MLRPSRTASQCRLRHTHYYTRLTGEFGAGRMVKHYGTGIKEVFDYYAPAKYLVFLALLRNLNSSGNGAASVISKVTYIQHVHS